MEAIRSFKLQPVWRELCPIGQLLGRQKQPRGPIASFHASGNRDRSETQIETIRALMVAAVSGQPGMPAIFLVHLGTFCEPIDNFYRLHDEQRLILRGSARSRMARSLLQ
jgi:hypothetical protein